MWNQNPLIMNGGGQCLCATEIIKGFGDLIFFKKGNVVFFVLFCKMMGVDEVWTAGTEVVVIFLIFMVIFYCTKKLYNYIVI